MSYSIDTINILIILAAVGNLIYGGIVFSRNKGSFSNKLFFALTVSVSLWGIAMFLFRSATDERTATFIARLLYVAASLIPVSFSAFTSLFPKKKLQINIPEFTLTLVSLLLVVYVVLFTNLFISGVHFTSTEPIIIFNFYLHLSYALYISIFFLLGFIKLFYSYQNSSGLLRTQLIYMMIGALVPTFLSMITNLLFPLVGIFYFNWFGQISTAFMTGIITYGIFRHRLFNVRVLGAEVLIFVLLTIAFIRIIFADSAFLIFINTIVFMVISIVGLLLIRSVNREVDTKEKLEKLANELQDTNEKLKILDQQKSEFLSIATHQLRGPLSGIRGHLSLIVEGAYGKVPDKISDVLIKVFHSSGILAETINDFLNVSRIEQGRMKYTKTDFDISTLIDEIIEDLSPVAKKKKLKLEVKNECKKNVCNVNADRGKLTHIFFNLIDNAIKYTEKGWIKIHVFTDKGTVRVEVSDSGMGIDKTEIHNLFEKFVRAKGSAQVNVNGTGLGLYVARKMVEAHNGKIWAESKGKGKGSTFIVELPRV